MVNTLRTICVSGGIDSFHMETMIDLVKAGYIKEAEEYIRAYNKETDKNVISHFMLYIGKAGEQ